MRNQKQPKRKTLNELLEDLSVENEQHAKKCEDILRRIDELLGFKFED